MVAVNDFRSQGFLAMRRIDFLDLIPHRRDFFIAGHQYGQGAAMLREGAVIPDIIGCDRIPGK